MDREQLLCYLEAALSLERATQILNAEQVGFVGLFDEERSPRLDIARERDFYLSFYRPRCQDILTDMYRISCLLDDLYSYDILPRKFLSPAVLPILYESYATEKCDSLDGPGGAYERFLDGPDETPEEERRRLEASIVSLFNGLIRRHAMAVSPIKTHDALTKDIFYGAAAIGEQLDRRNAKGPVDVSPYTPALAGIDDWIRLARACYSRWLSAYSDEG